MIKSAVVTGAGSGIGRALCHKLSDKGIHVLGIGRRLHMLEETASYAGGLIKPFAADICDQTSLSKIVESAQHLPKPLGLFHGAGVFQIGKLLDLEQSKWESSFHINVTARFMLTKALTELLNDGRVLFIGSDAGKRVRVGASAYSVAQAASETLANALKLELVEKNVAVGLFKPGLVETDMVNTFMQSSEQDFPDVAFYKDWVAKGQIAKPETIAEFASWLLLKTEASEFTENLWDIREESHHDKWLDGVLYPTYSQDGS